MSDMGGQPACKPDLVWFGWLFWLSLVRDGDTDVLCGSSPS